MATFINTAFGKQIQVTVEDVEDGIARISWGTDGSWAFVKETSLTERGPQPEPADSGVDLSGLPEGTIYVAVGRPLQFFRIDHVADGKWAGWVFVKRQAGDTFDRVGSQKPGATYRGTFAVLLAEVAKNPTAFMQAYGQEIGRCGNCNRTLTDEESRQRGIGPDCWAMLGAAAKAAYDVEEHYQMKAEYAVQEREQERRAFLRRLN